MLNFNKISYKNILSVGNSPVEIVFDEFKKTLITGTNGGGKSTLIEALAFVLYGKPFRKINKGSLVNSVNKKGMEIELSLTVKSDEYLVKRSIKPNAFSIIKNGVELPQHGSASDYQDMLEETVLKMSFVTFKQIIVLGTAGFEPFMDLDAPKRRAIVEDLVDVGIFTKMSDMNKLTIRDLRTELTIETNSLESLNRILAVQEKNSVDIIDANKVRIDTLQVRYDSNLVDGKELKSQLVKMVDDLNVIDTANAAEIAKLNGEISNNLSDLDQSTDIEDLKNSHIELVNDFIKVSATKYNSFKLELDDEYIADKLEHDKVLGEITSRLYPKTDVSDKTNTINSSKADIKVHNITIAANTKRLEFFEHTVECPTCESSLDDAYRDKMSKLLIDESTTCKVKIADLELVITECDTFITDERIKHDKSVKEIGEEVRNENTAYGDKSDILRDKKISRESQDTKNIAEFTRGLSDNLTEFKVSANANYFEYQKSSQNNLTSVKDGHVDSTKGYRDDIQELKTKTKSILLSVKSIKDDIDSLNREQEHLKANTGDIDKAKSDIRECELKVKTNTLEIKNLTILQTLLKDDGIKAKVIKQYIPFINSSINGYLKTMGSTINFTLDEQFNEKIKSRGREEFTYNSFSQGEKMRIDVAIMFTWRDVVRKRTNFLSNLLIMDEVMDGASDDAGIKSLHQLIDLLNDNVFIISHNETHDLDKFDNHLTMQKKGNFTYKMQN
jgi:DNA repair exonuclease SbcCD ATPase subunit